MNPGEMREKVTIQAESRAADTIGGAALDWTEVATVWANVVPSSGGEFVRSEELSATVTHRVTVRFRDDLTAANRLVWRGVPLQIRSVLPDRWRRYMVLECEEGENT